MIAAHSAARPIDPTGITMLERHELKVIAAAIWVDMAAAQTVFIQPAYVDTLANYGGLGTERAGYILSIEMMAFAITTIAMALVSHRISWHKTLWTALSVIAAGNIASIFVADPAYLLAVRLVVGAASGLVVPIAFATVGRLSRPERAFGIMIGVLLLYAAGFLSLMPFFAKVAGVGGLMGGMLFTCLLGMLFMAWFPVEAAHQDIARPAMGQWPTPGQWLALTGMLLFFTQLTSFWSFASVIAGNNGVAAGAVAGALAISQVAGIAGTALPAMAGNRLAVPIALLLAIVCCIAAPALLLFHTDATTFLAAVIFFHFGWNLGHAYLLALFARLDASSHLIFMATAMQKIGIAAGPAIATVMYGRKGGDAVLLLALVIGLVALAALTPAARRQATAAL